MLKDEIQRAIAAHGGWKQKLRTAIEAGSTRVPIADVRADNKCAFGQFLYEKLDPSKRNSEDYRKCRDLHSQFHQSAAHVLELAVAGNKKEANQAMAINSQFAKTSALLTGAMMNWQKSGG
jgi:hypothetical protein